MQANPAMRVENLHPKQAPNSEPKKSRRPFTIEELQKLLKVVDQEWNNLILFGLYTGQRLGDLSTLTWGNIHLSEEELRFRSKKTGRNVIMPWHLRYCDYLIATRKGEWCHSAVSAGDECGFQIEW